MAVLKTTFDHYIKNPAIVGTSSLMYTIYAKSFSDRFDVVLMREGGEINYTLYEDKSGNRYIHAKIPSEVVPKFYYDIVIEFMDDTMLSVLPSLERYDIKFFSNDPAFSFNYVYAFNKSGLLIDILKPKLSKEALENRAIVRNPKSNIGPVKAFYFMYYFMKIKKLFSKSNWTNVKELKPGTFNKLIENADKKIAERIELGKEYKHQKPSKKEIKQDEAIRRELYGSPQVRFVNKAKPVKKASGVRKAPTAKSVRKTKTVSRSRKSKR